MKKKTARSKKSKIIAFGLAAVLTTAGFFFLSSGQKKIKVPAYEVLRVIDGDTFITKEKQYIRLSSVSAPEIGDCGGSEAKTELEKLISNKPIYLKVLFRDKYQRLVSLVYTGDMDINKKLIAEGFAYYYNRDKLEQNSEYKKIGEEARQKNKGIFSQKCTQFVNRNNPDCDVKGNNRNGKIYYTKNCGTYNNVAVQLYLGDKWFCSELEAIKNGFRKTKVC